MTTPVAIIMGSQSDWETMRHAAETLAALGVACDKRIVSAHRTPERLYAFAKGAKAAGFKVIIAGAGGAAHLPGMAASLTELPVFGVPIESKALSGQDSLLSIVQMPAGVPVGTLAIGEPGATNAGVLAAQILALEDKALAQRLEVLRAKLLGLLNTPATIHRVLVENTDGYRRTPASIRILRTVVGKGLILSEGEEWRHQRRTIAPALAPRRVGAAGFRNL